MHIDRVRGLRDYWDRRLRHVASPPDAQRAERMLLDALGLGLEQTIRHLMHERPDFGAFTDWIVAMAGPPDCERIERYHAALDGAPPPPATATRLVRIDALPDVLTAEDLAGWEANGYAVLLRAITHAEAEAAASLIWETIAARPDDPASWYGNNVGGFWSDLYQHPALEPARRSERVHKAFAQLWGTSDLWTTIDRTSFNPPETGSFRLRGPRLHWDVSLARPIPFGTQAILYLSDTAEDQGALELVPGFHHRIDAWLDELGSADPRQVDLSPDAMRIPAKAGDLIIWRQDLPHGASPNRAGTPRLAQYLNMYPAWYTAQGAWL